MTGVQDNHIGTLGAVDLPISEWRQSIRHPTRVVDIHLAAK
jgi:hypothetical protein